MLFSSPLFLYLFLPLTLLGYYLSPGRIKNYWLLLTSLIFFAWGGVSYTVILIISIILNYVFGLLIQANTGSRRSHTWLVIGVATNIGLLAVFKYTNFFIENINSVLLFFSLPKITFREIDLPIGISFYTFHALSYLVDIYRKKTTAQKNVFNLALYISMFSQLIAGPIIRYSDVWQQLYHRSHSFEKFASGVERFLIGLGKKVLLANTLAKVADTLFSMDTDQLGAANAWLGMICYSLQIYCDFAGYSDMAIGLGRMFGFEFMENFNFPYLAKSVKEFWRRWHISLSTFFRDYVYIPLGGNRVSPTRGYINLIVVFFLTGFWHGASWSFVVWGLFHGFFMLLERGKFGTFLEKTWKPLANTYTLLVVMFAWVLFRADTLSYALSYWKALFDFNMTPEKTSLFMGFFNNEFIVVLLVAVAGSFGLFSRVYEWVIIRPATIAKNTFVIFGFDFVSIIFYIGILVLSTLYLVAGSYNPFIYYKF